MFMDIVEKYFTGLSERQSEQFQQLEGLYREWNEKINVISRKDIDALNVHHVLHSLAIAKVISFKAGQKCWMSEREEVFPEFRWLLCFLR